jgi:hypothetical protein
VLPIATLIHNNSKNATTKMSPNLLLIRREPPATLSQAVGASNPTAEQWVRQLREQRIMATQAVNRVAKKHGPPGAKWKQGQQVWLEAKNLSLPYGTIKLASRRHGPFLIKKIISPVAYQLCLPSQWGIHPVFHASLLNPFVETKEHRENYSQPPSDLINDEKQYKVEAIRSHRCHRKKKQLQYLVKWKGYPESDNTWEPANHIQAPRLLKQYERRQPLSIKRTQGRPLHQPPNWVTNADTPASALNARAPTSPILTLLHFCAPTLTPHTSSPSLSLTAFRGMKRTSSTSPMHDTSLRLTPSPPATPAQTLSALLTTRRCLTPPSICQTNLQHRPPATPPQSKTMNHPCHSKQTQAPPSFPLSVALDEASQQHPPVSPGTATRIFNVAWAAYGPANQPLSPEAAEDLLMEQEDLGDTICTTTYGLVSTIHRHAQ